MLDALAQHHLVEDLATGHANKRVVHLRSAVGLQRLDAAVVLAVEGGRWAGARLCLRGGSGGALCADILLDDLCGGGLGGTGQGR